MDTIIVVLVVILPILGGLCCCVVARRWCCGGNDSSKLHSYYPDPENSPFISQEADDDTPLEIGSEDVKLSLEDDYTKEYKTPYHISYDCQHYTTSFTNESKLIEHQEPGAQYRFYMYIKVRFTPEVQKAMLRRRESANLIKDNYNESKNVVCKVLARILRHKSNGGRFSTRFDQEGSTKTGLKTRKATEFDFTVPLLFQDEPTITADTEEDHFHVGKQTSSTAHVWLSPRDSMKFQDCCLNRCLLPKKLKETFLQFVSSAASEIGIPLVLVNVSKAENGPAVKLTIKSREIKHHISVDFTPKIVVPKTCALKKQALNWPREKTFQAYRKCIDNILTQSIYLVPKKEQVWSVSLANYETALLHVFPNRSMEKKLLRYMKTRLEAWQTQQPELRPISSYMLKEVFFWLRENMSDVNLWTGNKCADRYYFLQEIKFCFENRQLLDYFNNSTDHLKGKEKCIPKLLELVTQEMASMRVEN